MTVDVRYDTVIRCDASRCKQRFCAPTSRTYARKAAAAEEGWSYVGAPDYRDLCPDHKKGSDG